MAIAQIEATLDALKSKLDAGLAAKITAINADVTDGFTIENPVLVQVGVKDQHDYPAIFVLPDRTTAETESAGGFIWLHRVRVASFVAEWDEEGLTRKVIRYQRAVREVILEGNREPGGAGGFTINFESDEYGPVFSPTDSGQAEMTFVQGASSLFVVRQTQTLA